MREISLISIIGGLCVIAGIGLIIFQMIYSPPPPMVYGLAVSPTTLDLQTQYPGITMLCIGAMLLVIGSIGKRSN